LQAARLLRGTAAEGRDEVETYHDRIREAVVAGLAPEALRGHHRQLAEALQAAGRADLEPLALHYEGAEDPGRAAEYYARAADRAAEALAFDRAADLYRRALGLRPGAGTPTNALRAKRGDALANAGRGGEAAGVYLQAAEEGRANEALELRRRAALQLLASWHIDEGVAALRAVLGAVGMRLPDTPRKAFRLLLLHRLLLRARGLRFRARDAGQVPAEALRRIDVCWSAATGLGVIEPIGGALFQTRGLLLALRAGEPYRLARALANEAAFLSLPGSSSGRRPGRVLEMATSLAQKVGQPDIIGFSRLAQGMLAFLNGCWASAREHLDAAEEVFRRHGTGVVWERNTAQLHALLSLFYLGEWAEMGRRAAQLVQEGRDRGNLYLTTHLGTAAVVWARLAADDPEGARHGLAEAMARLPRRGYYVPHYSGLIARVMIDLYGGRGEAALAAIDGEWSDVEGSSLRRLQVTRTLARFFRARCTLAAAETARPARPLLRRAAGHARQLTAEGTPWAAGLAQLVRAGVTAARGDRASAAPLLADAARRLDDADMHLWASATRRRLGELLGNGAGRELVREADAWMAAQGIRNPARMAAVFAPGLLSPTP
jgi:hypothetical protein